MAAPDLRPFEYDHLPPADQMIASHFRKFAQDLSAGLPDGVSKNVAIAYLLNARDAAVRANANPKKRINVFQLFRARRERLKIIDGSGAS